MEKERFVEWSKRWKALRSLPPSSDAVLKMWKEQPPMPYLKRDWDIAFGYRKRTETRGEKEIERLLLHNQREKVLRIYKGKNSIKLTTTFHNFAMAASQKGQVLADCLGYITWRRTEHPVAIEVKVNANDPWFAVVENLQQVKMLRSNIANLGSFLSRSNIAAKGAWGLVIASSDYYTKKKKFRAACSLLDRINTRKTEARIMLLADDNLEKGRLDHIYGYWPR